MHLCKMLASATDVAAGMPALHTSVARVAWHVKRASMSTQAKHDPKTCSRPHFSADRAELCRGSRGRSALSCCS